MANAYGMIGGQSGDKYIGSYNITPTTSDITLNTKDKVLEGDMTIQGSEFLRSYWIKYGVSIFYVSGTAIVVNFRGGYGTAFKNGVLYDGDIINAVNEVPTLTAINEMETVSNKYTVNTDIYNQEFLARYGNRYMSLRVEGSYPNFTALWVQLYENETLIQEINLFNIINTGYTIYQLVINRTVDPKTGKLVLITKVNDARSLSDNRHNVFLQIFNMDGTYISKKVADYGGWSDSFMPHITEDYVAFCYSEADSSYNYTYYFAIYDLYGNKIQNPTIQNAEALIGSSCLCVYFQNNVYLFNKSLHYSHEGYSYNVAKYTLQGTLVYQREIAQTDLLFTGGSRTSSENNATLLMLGVNENENVSLYYSNSLYGDYPQSSSGITNIAVFNSSMTNKISDIQLVPIASLSLSSFLGDYWYDSTTKTLLYSCINGIIRVDFTGNIYAYKYGSPALEGGVLPYILTSGEVDYTGGSPYTYIDTSVNTSKTIETSSYTATIEEV